MKTVKPFRVGALTQTFEVEKKCYLTVAILVCFELGEDPALASDLELWRRPEELGPLGVLDECHSKARAEVLVNGHCFAAGGVPQPGASVRLAVGPAGSGADAEPPAWSIDKTLYVVGDRTFRIDGTPSDPTPFTTMPLTYERAFGGPAFAPNPVGTGFAPQKENGLEQHRLPNVEDPAAMITGRGDRPAPAGFGPFPKHWPQRASKIGTYDSKWVKNEAPAFARDLDLSHFNTAPEDQQIEGHFRGNERFLLENMHPDKPVLRGRLPGVVGRCFITQREVEGGEAIFREIPARLDTIRFFPHLDRGLMVFHALARVAEDDADDVEKLLVACDEIDAPRPLEHFREVLAARLDRGTDRGVLLREEDLVPKRVLRGDVLGAFGELSGLVKSEGHVAKNIRNRMEQENERTRASLVASGVKPADAKVEPVPELELDADAERGFAQIAALLAEEEGQKSRAAREVEAAEETLRAQYKERGRDYDAERQKSLRDAAGPPKFSADGEMERLRDIRQLVENAGQDTSELDVALEDPATYARFKQVEDELRESYRRTAHVAAFAAGRLEEPERSRVRARIEEAHREGLAFDGMDLTGADLSGLDLSGASLRGALLESANLAKTRLAGADLTGAVLACADLAGAVLTGAKLAEANLGGASLVEADLADIGDWTGTILARADLARAVITRGVFDRTSFLEAKLDGVDFRETRMKNAIFYKNDLGGARFGAATLFQCVFLEVDLAGADFSRATVDRSSFVGCRLDGAKFLEASAKNLRLVRRCSLKGCDFRGADMTRSTFRDNDLSGSDFSLAKLDDSDFGKAVLTDANFYRAVARRCHFVRADLTRANLIGANLEAALMMKASVAGADFTGSNLFRANFLRAKGDPATSFKEADVTRVFHGSKDS